MYVIKTVVQCVSDMSCVHTRFSSVSLVSSSSWRPPSLLVGLGLTTVMEEDWREGEGKGGRGRVKGGRGRVRGRGGRGGEGKSEGEGRERVGNGQGKRGKWGIISSVMLCREMM